MYRVTLKFPTFLAGNRSGPLGPEAHMSDEPCPKCSGPTIYRCRTSGNVGSNLSLQELSNLGLFKAFNILANLLLLRLLFLWTCTQWATNIPPLQELISVRGGGSHRSSSVSEIKFTPFFVCGGRHSSVFMINGGDSC